MSLEELLKSSENLEDYLREYGDNSTFLYHFFMQDLNRLLDNHSFYVSYLTPADQVKIGETIISQGINDDKLITIISNLANLGWPEETRDFRDKIYKLVDEGKIDVEKTGDVELTNRYYQHNPLKTIEKNINNICMITKKVNREEFIYIIDYLKTFKYEFKTEDQFFLKENVFNDLDNFIYFVNNVQINEFVSQCIRNNLDTLSQEQLKVFYDKCNEKTYKNSVVRKLNFDNYNFDTILFSEQIFFNADNKHDEVIEFLKKAKEKGINQEIVLIMNRVDINFIDEAYNIYGDNIRISPIMNQERIKNAEVWYYPSYSVEAIKNSEKTFDLYTKTTEDKYDKDGDLKTLSPLEKFIAAYILTTKFAPYTEEEDKYNNYHVSRSVYEFIDMGTNRKIVCVGYVHLLREFLYRMGITDTMDWEVSAKNEKNFNDFVANHARMLIHLVDEKYNIDGVYICDPTWDSDFHRFKKTHLLLTKEEAINIFPKDNLFFNKSDKIEKGLNIDNLDKLFSNKIPKEAIIRAYLAVEHFVDQDMKMVKDNNYDLLDYCEMAVKLGYDDVVRDNIDKIYQELIKMKPSEIDVNYPSLMPYFGTKLESSLEKDLFSMGKDNTIGYHYDKKNGKAIMNLIVNPKSFDINTLDNRYQYELINRRTARIPIYTLLDRPIIEQYQDIIESINHFNETVYNSTLESDNRTK